MTDKERIEQLEKSFTHLVMALTNVLAVIKTHEEVLDMYEAHFKVLAREIYKVEP